MHLDDAYKLAQFLMAKHGLQEDWQFDFDTSSSRIGQCIYARKTITVSSKFTGAASEEQFVQAVLHEVAHALVGPFHTPKYGHPTKTGHGNVWKRKAREIGHSGDRLSINPYVQTA